jgi:hypothetical protein
MGTTKSPINANDYAVAKALSEEVMGIIIMVLIVNAADLPDDYQITELNRAYVLLTNELQILYDRNSELAEIRPEPIWKRFDVLKTSTRGINEHVADPYIDAGQAHIVRIDRLCIIANTGTPNLSPDQKKLIDEAKSITSKYGKMIDKAYEANKRIQGDDCYIHEYTLTYKYGLILINDVLKLKKAHERSTLDKLMLKALENPNQLFNPILDSKRTVSTTLSNAGFTVTLRKLFFPEAGSRGVLFRPIITSETARAEHINTTELDLQLKELGATTEPVSPS